MGDLTELLGVNSDQATQFFFRYLNNEVASSTSSRVAQIETAYVASILAHYAQTSRYDPESMPPALSLHEILDSFVLPAMTNEGSIVLQDPEILEIAGSQTLLLVGFFRDQMNRRRHNLSWYDELGRSFYVRAASTFSGSEKKSELLWRISEHFPDWARSCRNISRTIRDERYLLRLDS
jgi:hypothetical protein